MIYYYVEAWYKLNLYFKFVLISRGIFLVFLRDLHILLGHIYHYLILAN
jgi:hypothetical protein